MNEEVFLFTILLGELTLDNKLLTRDTKKKRKLQPRKLFAEIGKVLAEVGIGRNLSRYALVSMKNSSMVFAP